MAESGELAKAVLQELRRDLTDVEPDGQKVTVQFNPETLKLSFANQIVTQPGAGTSDTSSGTAGRQFVGSGTTKLSLQLWFDVTAQMPKGEIPVDDVRKLTQKVVFFITPQPVNQDPTKLLPPGVRFQWGSFQFDGLMDSLEESVEFFSSEGKPLRASMSLNLSQQKILKVEFKAGAPPGKGAAPGTRPLVQVSAGATLQGLASIQGKGGSWQDIAAANGIENPRLLQPGQLIDMNASVSPQLL